MKVTSGTLFQRKNEHYALIGLVNLDHPVSESELYFLNHDTIEHIEGFKLDDESIAFGFESVLLSCNWPNLDFGRAVRFISIDAESNSYLLYSASKNPLLEGSDEQFITLDNGSYEKANMEFKTNGLNLYQVFSLPVWKNKNFKNISITAHDKFTFGFFKKYYPALKEFSSGIINHESFVQKMNLTDLEKIVYKRHLILDINYLAYLKIRLKSFYKYSRITSIDDLTSNDQAASTLVKSLI